MRYQHILIIVLLVLSGCTSPTVKSHTDQISTRWSVGCTVGFWKGLATAMHGKQSFHANTPCKRLSFHTHHSFYGATQNPVPKAQSFTIITSGHIANWSWTLAGTPPVVRHWATTSFTPNNPKDLKGHHASLRVSFPVLFRDIYLIYSYVLAASPPRTQYVFDLFPVEESINRTVTTSTRDRLHVHFYIPYFRSVRMREGNAILNPQQATYFYVRKAAAFEYIHALFFTQGLKVPNVLGQSVAGKVIYLTLRLMEWSRNAKHKQPTIFPSADSLIAQAKKQKKTLLNHGHVDAYGAILAVANMAHALGANTHKARIYAKDRAKILRLLKLARAMLQQPVNFMQQPLYPLKRLDSITTVRLNSPCRG